VIKRSNETSTVTSGLRVKMKSIISISWSVLMMLQLLLRSPVVRTLKSNHMSPFKLLNDTTIVTHLQGSRSRTADCPVLPPCHCVQLPHSTHQESSSRVRVMCNSTQSSRRRILRFSKSSILPRSFDHLSLAYAGLNALPADTFRHITVTLIIDSLLLDFALIITK